ncbi:SocA family protein [Candidatus Saccharibacteria bacterium]|nr:SocA family protein [Candidatus Saccharibacteria bacterium]
MNEKKASKNVIKVSQALGFLLSLDDNHKMDRVKLIKLLWAADRLHLRRYGRTISESDYYAMAHGPVCSLALDIPQMDKDGIVLSDADKEYLEEYFTSDDRSTSMQKDVGDGYLSESDKAMLKEAWEKFKDIETFELSDDISHRYPEWSKFRKFFETNGGRKNIDLEDFFKNPDNDEYFAEDEDRLEAARGIYEDNKEAQKELAVIFGIEG